MATSSAYSTAKHDQTIPRLSFHVVFRNPTSSLKLAMHVDNLYLVGFKRPQPGCGGSSTTSMAPTSLAAPGGRLSLSAESARYSAVFFPHSKSANSTFCHDLSAKRIKTRYMQVKTNGYTK